MFRTIIDAFKVKEIRNKILITLLLLFVYRVGCWIPCVGFDASVIFENSSGFGFFELMNMVSGGALANCSVLALGVSPYITASIVIQLLTVAIPALERLAKSGEDGRRKLNLYTRITALILALAQAIGIVVGYSEGMDYALTSAIPEWLVGCGAVIIMVAGSMFTVWIGERITDLGIGNGTSLLIFVGILSSAGTSVAAIISECFNDITYLWYLALFIVAIVIIFAFIVFMDNSEERVKVQYAKQIKGNKMYGGQSQHIPIKLNATGVMPIIFASALLTFPQLIISIFWPDSDAYAWYSEWMGTDSWLYIVLTALLILVFAFFYSKISFDPDDISKRLQQQGGFVTGIRPGKPTAEYLGRISGRLTFFGALMLAIIALIPSLAFKAIGDYAGAAILINAFSTTGLMIVVSVALELEKQLSAQMVIRNHKGFLN